MFHQIEWVIESPLHNAFITLWFKLVYNLVYILTEVRCKIVNCILLPFFGWTIHLS